MTTNNTNRTMTTEITEAIETGSEIGKYNICYKTLHGSNEIFTLNEFLLLK